MNISEIFIRRPIATTLIMSGIVGAGVLGYRQLPVSDLPPVEYPSVSVNASLSGASPETMASAVATPLEKQFSTIAGLDAMTSTSAQGAVTISMTFNLNRSIDAAAQDVQAAIAKVQPLLPSDMLPPSVGKSNPADQPILTIALTSKTLSLPEVDEYAETVLAPQLSAIDGVAQVNVTGAQKYAVRIRLDPQALAYRHIGVDQVVKAVSKSNVNSATGVLWGPDKALTLNANGQMRNASAFRSLIVAYRNGAPVRLGDLGQVLDLVQDTRQGSWLNGLRNVNLDIVRQPGTNTVEVAQAVRTTLARLQNRIPASLDVRILFDRSKMIREAVNDVKFTLALTLGLVVLVIFLFLRNIRTTFIPSMALPMSVVGTFAIMAMLGYSLDNLSLMALVLAVGFVVDDAIVMLENVHRHLEMGKRPLQAALDGSAEVGFTILSMTLSLAAVFIPVLFMGGMLGRLFHEFAITIGAAILTSGFVSLTLTPMMCSRLLREGDAHVEHGRLYNATERAYERVVQFYERSLRWVMIHRPATVIFSLLILVGSLYLFVVIPKGFIPTEDQGLANGSSDLVEGASFDEVLAHQKMAENILFSKPDKDVEAIGTSTGGGGAGHGANHFHVNLYLKPKSERKATAQEVARRVKSRLDVIPGTRNSFSLPASIRIGGKATNSTYQFVMQSPDLAALFANASVMEERMKSIPGIADVNTDVMIRSPQVKIDIDRQRAIALGVTPDQVETALYNSFGSRQISTIYTPNNQYQVIIEMLPKFQMDEEALNLLYVTSSSGALVPLSAVAHLGHGMGPFIVNHSGQLPSVTLSFNLREGTALGSAVDAVDALARRTLPSSITTSFAGQAQAFQESQKGLAFLLIVAVLVIYLVLGILYESFIHPITILSALPFATFGALVTLLIFKTDLNVYSYVGLIMLVGLVKKNGIMMIDFALETQRTGNKSPAEAIIEACQIRFRPIMMTTMCALMGTLPIALGVGAGAEARRPLGIAVVGGLLFSQMITLYVTPVIYTYMDSFQHWLAASSRRRAPAQAGAAEAMGAAD
jgi:HAE1 family hydrophobic/amphiphilic exporter-1